jgi:hypothetical protein
MALKIKSDKKWKNFKTRDEVPKQVLSRQFDWLDEDSGYDGFINYKGHWYHLSEFMRGGGMADWDGYHGDSYFSGVVIKVSGDGEQYKIGDYMEVG